MTNLRKNSSGSFDVLTKNTSLLSLNEGSEDEGFDFTLNAFYPIEIEILPQEGVARVHYRTLKAEVLEIEIPLGILVKQEFPISVSLGIPRKQTFEISMPLARIIKQSIQMLMSLKIEPIELRISVDKDAKPKFELKFVDKIGKPVKTTVETLKQLRELSKKLRG